MPWNSSCLVCLYYRSCLRRNLGTLGSVQLYVFEKWLLKCVQVKTLAFSSPNDNYRIPKAIVQSTDSGCKKHNDVKTHTFIYITCLKYNDIKLQQRHPTFTLENLSSIKVINHMLSDKLIAETKKKNQLSEKKLLEQWKNNIICSIF